ARKAASGCCCCFRKKGFGLGRSARVVCGWRREKSELHGHAPARQTRRIGFIWKYSEREELPSRRYP
ncbi:hypothetical protein SERLADRAFT_379566, partial [Serpula lacrymans var. lacrymans S7.9]